jgi:hypothetical protein
MSIERLLQYVVPVKIKRIGFEDVNVLIQQSSLSVENENFRFPLKTYIINTLHVGKQSCLIKGTISCLEEERLINSILEKQDVLACQFMIYGENANDESAERKYRQLLSLGCENIYLYSGGLFEWLLLQDIYGADEFPTTSKVLDIVTYRPAKTFF